jgi:hypothetical protein
MPNLKDAAQAVGHDELLVEEEIGRHLEHRSAEPSVLALRLNLVPPVPLLVVVPQPCFGAWLEATVVLTDVTKGWYEDAGVEPTGVSRLRLVEGLEGE